MASLGNAVVTVSVRTKTDTFVNILRGLAYVAICSFFGLATWTAYQVKKDAHQVADSANATITHLQSTGDAAISKLYEHAKLEQKNIDYLVLNAGLTANAARLASLKELAVLDKLNIAIDKNLGDLDKTIVSTNAAVKTINQTAKDVQPVLASATKAIDSANKVISNPDIPKTIANTADATGALKDSVKHVDAMVVDTADVWHHWLHPTWAKKIWNFVAGKAIPIATLAK